MNGHAGTARPFLREGAPPCRLPAWQACRPPGPSSGRRRRASRGFFWNSVRLRQLIATFKLLKMPAMKQDRHFTLEELGVLSGLTPRTIRFYVQKGLVDRPEGATKGSYYLARHLEQLLRVKKWHEAGLSLEGILELAGGSPPAVPEPRPRPGDVRVESRVYLAPGIHLCVDAARASLPPEALRALVRGVCALLKDLPAAGGAKRQGMHPRRGEAAEASEAGEAPQA